MSAFAAGVKVRICVSDDAFDGEYGTIRGERGEGENREFKIEFPEMGMTWYHLSEIEPVAMVELTPPTAETGARGDVRSLPQVYRDERMAAKERGEKIPDYTAWLESQVRQGEFYQDIQAERGNDWEAEAESLRSQLAAAAAALKPFKREWDAYQDYAKEQGGRADVGNYLTNYRDLDIIMDACKRAAKALQATGGSGEGAGE